MEEILVVNPKKKRKKSRRNPKVSKKKTRKNIEEFFLVNPRRKVRRARKNPGKFEMTQALLGGVSVEILEKVMRIFKKKDGSQMIPDEIKPLLAGAASILLLKRVATDDAISGAIGATAAKVLEKIESRILPQNIKSALGLSGVEEEYYRYLPSVPNTQAISQNVLNMPKILSDTPIIPNESPFGSKPLNNIEIYESLEELSGTLK
ncbi:MAG: hypothetical protein QXJ14_02795 [Candidatus Aenigmatarchaeota archaeon]